MMSRDSGTACLGGGLSPARLPRSQSEMPALPEHHEHPDQEPGDHEQRQRYEQDRRDQVGTPGAPVVGVPASAAADMTEQGGPIEAAPRGPFDALGGRGAALGAGCTRLRAVARALLVVFLNDRADNVGAFVSG